MAIEIVDFPIKHGDFSWQNVSSPEATSIGSCLRQSFGNVCAMFELKQIAACGIRFARQPHIFCWIKNGIALFI